eukprot:gb/GFBE01026914.1/.p1 GENE.gb/GFBE01026914.1/~~gb/GFBE01026914.1/.p1  ORF type:complete len:235 (+),score=41.93 gb/GFBE01026914.1/:1-705(+)
MAVKMVRGAHLARRRVTLFSLVAACAGLLGATGFVGIGSLQARRPCNTRRRAEDDGKIPISELEVGQELNGIVIRPYSFAGWFVDVGATSNGFLELEEVSDGFPSDGMSTIRKGSSVVARVLQIDGQKFYLTQRSGDLSRPPRFRRSPEPEHVEAFRDVPKDAWIDGEVSGMTTKGVWVKMSPPSGGEPIRSLLLKDNFKDGFVDEARPGLSVKVRVTAVDVPQKRVFITAKDS